ncbi:hypothetical protein [Pseudotabrizicola sp. 4114]|uniref:hypothetical protein n=1 Tax=Pseudotabrizicola sp. 4114 TaxID=2817731 RepID=UPI002863D81F|nr:hypothetical protein [Pseudorhodobacter sp. 4114]
MSAELFLKRSRIGWAALCFMAAFSANADPLDLARSAGISGSERMRMFAYGKLLETEAAPRAAAVQMKQSLIRQGFYYEPGSQRIIAAEAWAAPVLSYDGNINGGTLQDSFRFNGYEFAADPAYRAKAGAVFGFSAGGVGRLAWAEGRYIEGLVRGEAVWSPEHRIGRSNAELGLCSRNHVTGWTFVDLCHTLSRSNRELGSGTSQKTALIVSQLFTSGQSHHEVKAELANTEYAVGAQPAVTLSWGSAWNTAATKLSLTKAAGIKGETALNVRAAADVQWLWGKRAVGIGLWHQTADGGAFLGTPRSDKATGISLSYQINTGLTAQVGYMVNRSTADFFDYALVTVNMRYDALRW